MTTVPWLDAATPPSPAQAQAARRQGFVGVGWYPPGVPNTDPYRTWSKGEEQVLVQAGLKAVPIVVPSPNLAGDPVLTAQAAFHVVQGYGLNPKVSVLYDGPHCVNTGRITGPVWLPLPQSSAPTSVGPGSAIQWGQGFVNGWSVDYNVAAPDFPFDVGLVCDFEHAELGYRTLDECVTWYQAFQAEVSRLAQRPAPSPDTEVPFVNLCHKTITLTTDTVGRGWTVQPVPVPFASVCGAWINPANLAEGQPATPGTAKAADWAGGIYVELDGAPPNSTVDVIVAYTS